MVIVSAQLPRKERDRVFTAEMRCRLVASIVLFAPLAHSQDAAFFESKIRPVLVSKCYACHSSKLSSPMGGLTLDTKAGLAKGGATGAILVPGKPDESRLLQAIRF